jgi:hypothetical protein
MANERAILCGDVATGSLPFGGHEPVVLHLWGGQGNIKLQVNDIQSHLLQEIPSPFHDLIEIATYVYCGDQAVTRGGAGVDDFGSNWRRRLFFRIPVRNPDLWNDSQLQEQLIETLSFLSEDEYHFEFHKLRSEPPRQQHLDFGVVAPQEVVLFSGGLDSLGGDQRQIVLVNHRPTQKMARRYRKLKELLAQHAAHPPVHIPVVINKAKVLGREYTQRTRSFLYAALGATVAQMFGLSRLRFYENGIVSFNLPVSAQVVGAKATRTTHPQVINGFAKLLSLISGKPFVVESPFLWKTKADVLKVISDSGCAEMIKFATSCTHTWDRTTLKTHCGMCSQCIDRRFAVLASGLEEHDPAEAYDVDLLVGDVSEQKKSEARMMLTAYVETANDVADMSALDFFGRYGEVFRAVKHLDGSAESTALKMFELHQRHARYVTKVVDDAIASNRSAIRKRRLPDSCLLRLVCDSSVPTSSPTAVPDARSLSEPEIGAKIDGDFLFRPINQSKKKPVWLVRFRHGRKFILLPSKGAAYLHILLSKPKTAIPAIDLVVEVARNPKKYALGDSGDVLDRQSLSAYQAAYEQLKEDLEEAERLEGQGMAAMKPSHRIREEMDLLAKEVAKAKGLGGRIRKAGDDKERVRKAVSNAIGRVIKKEIAPEDPALADHLSRPRLIRGKNPSYDPCEDGIEWSTDQL